LDASFLMPVSGKYRDLGTVVTGKIESGQIRKGDTLMLMPNRQSTEALAVFIEENEVRQARSGDNVRIRLKGIEEEEVTTGFVLCDPIRPVKATTAFIAQLVIMQIKNILTSGYKAVMHIHSASEEVTIAALLNTVDKKTMTKSARPPVFVRQNDIVIAKIECHGAVCLEAASDCDPLGRFTLRDEGKTIAVGKVLQVLSTEID